MGEYIYLGETTLRVSGDTGWLHLYDGDGSVLLTQEQVKDLLPYLQVYAETGKIKQEGGES
jgi:hypothetical protein